MIEFACDVDAAIQGIYVIMRWHQSSPVRLAFAVRSAILQYWLSSHGACRLKVDEVLMAVACSYGPNILLDQHPTRLQLQNPRRSRCPKCLAHASSAKAVKLIACEPSTTTLRSVSIAQKGGAASVGQRSVAHRAGQFTAHARRSGT